MLKATKMPACTNKCAGGPVHSFQERMELPAAPAVIITARGASAIIAASRRVGKRILRHLSLIHI